jgi:hypothetical protein
MRFLLDSNPIEINKEEKEEVFRYKYKGGDTSILYKYFYSPFADFLVNYIPMNVA